MKTTQELESTIESISALLELKNLLEMASQKEGFALQISVAGIRKDVKDPDGVESFRKYYCASLTRQIEDQQKQVDNLLTPIVYPTF